MRLRARRDSLLTRFCLLRDATTPPKVLGGIRECNNWGNRDATIHYKFTKLSKRRNNLLKGLLLPKLSEDHIHSS